MEIQEEFVCGGLSSLNTEVDDKLKQIISKLRPKIETKLGRTLELLEPIRYRSQIVAGTNYFVKCHLGQNECIHLLVYEPLPCYGGEPELIGISPNKHSIEDPIEAHQLFEFVEIEDRLRF
ncbi:hypothetical protein NH340_JMT05738 [Sarcoptes scabiei]|nr:hypothetical protein NH340_JMT05738 [Sarcoptes scabiei]